MFNRKLKNIEKKLDKLESALKSQWRCKFNQSLHNLGEISHIPTHAIFEKSYDYEYNNYLEKDPMMVALELKRNYPYLFKNDK